MYLLRSSMAGVMLALLVTTQHMSEDSLQSLEPYTSNTNSTPEELSALNFGPNYMSNVTDHAQIPDKEGLQTQINNEEENTGEEFSNLEASTSTQIPTKKTKKGKKSSVPKKEAIPSKSSVPKKGVHFAPSVVPKKGADPESSTQSVSPRKGVGVPEPKQIHPEAEQPELPSSGEVSEPPLNIKFRPTPKLVTGVSENDMIRSGKDTTNSDYEKESNTPVPHIIDTDEKQKENLMLENANQNLTSSATSAIAPVITPVNELSGTSLSHDSKKLSSMGVHFKPVAAVDELDANGSRSESDHVNYTLVILGIVLVVAFIVLIVVGYRKFQDVWMRRHYNHVDFLVDGMYDE